MAQLPCIGLSYFHHNVIIIIHTVDGRNPAPPDMYETLLIMGCLQYQLVQDFFHQQYVSLVAKNHMSGSCYVQKPMKAE